MHLHPAALWTRHCSVFVLCNLLTPMPEEIAMSPTEYLRAHQLDQAHVISSKVLQDALIQLDNELQELKSIVKALGIPLPVLTPELHRVRRAAPG